MTDLNRAMPWRVAPSTLTTPLTIFKYNPQRMSVADLLCTFVGREELLADLLSWLRSQRLASEPKHMFLFGPRGIGKTTMLLVLRHTVLSNPGLAKAFVPVQFSEEERRVTNLTSFAMRTFELLAGEVEELGACFEAARQEVLAAPHTAVDRLLAAAEKLGDRQALLLIDNFDELAAAAVTNRGQAFDTKQFPPLDGFVQFLRSPRFLIVATALQPPDKRKDLDRLGVLAHFSLKKLEPVHNAMALLEKRAESDRRTGFREILPRLAKRIDGLNRLADGNPRLLVFLYECLGEHPVRDLVEIVQLILDGLTPMYQDVLDKLVSRGQGAILDMLALRGGVGTAKEIAERTYQEEQTVRTFLGDLCDLGMVVRTNEVVLLNESEPASTSGTVFRVHPPLFQIWYEMRHLNRESWLYLVRFFSLLTEGEELRSQFDQLPLAERASTSSDIGHLVADVLDVLDPEWQKLREDLVERVLAEKGTLRDALGRVDQALSAPANSPYTRIGLLLLRSGLYLDIGDRAAAVKDLEEAGALADRDHFPETRVKFRVAKSELLCGMNAYADGLREAREAVAVCDALVVHGASAIRVRALLALANAHYAKDRYRDALASVAQARTIMGTAVDEALETRFALLEGTSHDALGEYDRAIECFESGLLTARERCSRRDEAALLRRMGNAYDSLSEFRRASEYCEQALAISREIGDRRGEGKTLGSLGNAYLSLGEVRRAVEYYERGLAISREIGDRGAEGNHLGNLGNAYGALGEVRRAIEYYEQALAISREIGDRRAEGTRLSNMGNAYLSLGEVRRAIEYHEQAMAISREIGDRGAEGNHLGNLGSAYGSLGEFRRAIEHCEQALAISREIGGRSAEGSHLGNLGNAYLSLGEVGRAIEYYEQALAISREIGDRRAEGSHLGNLGNAYLSLGEVRRAIEYYEQALAISREIGDRSSEATSLGNLGNAYLSLGEVRRAIEYYEQALAISREIGDRSGEGSHLGNLGNAYLSLGEVRRAIEYCEQALAISRGIGDRSSEAAYLGNLGSAHLSFGDLGKANELCEQALVLSRETGARGFQAKVLAMLGRAALQEGRCELAVSRFAEAHRLFVSCEDRSGVQGSAGDMVNALYRCATAALRGSLNREAGQWAGQALGYARDAGAEVLLSGLVNHLLIPTLQATPSLVGEVRSYVRQIREDSVFAEKASLLRPVEAVLDFYASGRSREALDALGPTEFVVAQSIIRRVDRPKHAEALEMLKAGKAPEAGMLLEEILSSTPDDVEARLNLASALLAQGKLPEAEKEVRAVLAGKQAPTAAFLVLSQIQASRGDVAGAIGTLEEASRNQPDAKEVYAFLAELLRHEKRFAELACALNAWRNVEADEARRTQVATWAAEAFVLAGDPARASVALPPEGAIPRDVPTRLRLGALRVLIALHRGDSAAARKHAAALLQTVADTPRDHLVDIAQPDFLQRASELLDEHSRTFFVGLIWALTGRVGPVAFAEEFLKEEAPTELRARADEEAELALKALRAGKLNFFSDLVALSTRSVGPAAALDRLGEQFAEVTPPQQRILVNVFLAALRQGRPLEAEAALGALGQNFAALDVQERTRFLESLTGLAGDADVEPLTRERGVRVANVLYPNISRLEQERLRSALDKVPQQLRTAAFAEFFQQTVPQVQRRE